MNMRNAPNTSSGTSSGTQSNAQAKPAAKPVKQTVAVQIAGRDYKIRTDSDEESLQRVAGYVDRAMSRIRVATSTVDTQDVAMLTCLNLARQLLSLHAERTAALSSGGAAGAVAEGSEAVSENRLRELIERVEEVGSARVASAATATAKTDAEAAPAVAEEREPARTLELPSPEVLRERSANEAATEAATETEPQAKMAAGGGRDRAS